MICTYTRNLLSSVRAKMSAKVYLYICNRLYHLFVYARHIPASGLYPAISSIRLNCAVSGLSLLLLMCISFLASSAQLSQHIRAVANE